jgi:phosphoribosylglycinamide formyltransferase 1
MLFKNCMNPIRLAIFASGSGSNAENLVRYFSEKDSVEVVLVLSNKTDAYVHERSRKLGIPSTTLPGIAFKEGKPVLDLMKEYRIDFIVLAGFLLLIPQILVEAYPGKIVNIHPALLPKFGGKGMYGDRVHHAVVEAGEKQSGITIHLVNEHYDEGSILFQAVCPVAPEDTPDKVAGKVHELEYSHFPEVVFQYLRKKFGI